jgi:hypothetical protein
MQDDPKLPPLPEAFRACDFSPRAMVLPMAEVRAIQLSAFNAGRLKGLEAGFDAGWKTAANWAGRDDLLSDMESPAFKADRAAAIDRIAKKEAKSS